MTKILKLNGFNLAAGEWTEIPYFKQTTKQRQETYQYLYNTLYNQWLPLQHYKQNVGHIKFPTTTHDKPKSRRDREKAARKEAQRLRHYQLCITNFEVKARKAQGNWLMKQTKWIKNRRFSF
jgi:hypothetical protein